MAFGELFSVRRPPPAGKRVHVVTNSGGEGNLIADIAADCGLQLPAMTEAATAALTGRWPRLAVRNPLDPWGADDYPAIFPDAIRCAAEEPGDILIVAMDQHRASGEHERELGLALGRYLHQASSGRDKLPVLLSPVSDDVDPRLAAFCREARLPLLRGARPAVSALAKLVDRRTVESTPVVGTAGRPLFLPPGSVNLIDDEALSALAALGVATPARRHAATPREAAAAAAELSTAVVLKGVADGIVHKTELGLVDIAPPDVAAAAEKMRSLTRLVDLRFLVTELVRGQLEVLVGFKRDPTFGPTMVIGVGGIWTEFFDTASVHVGGLTPALAQQFLDESAVGAMIANARGGRLCSSALLVAMLAVSDLALANPDIASIDINPLIVGRDHATAVDAVIECQPIHHHSEEIPS
jgi:acetate---CoA ligase (ADP-forming)